MLQLSGLRTLGTSIAAALLLYTALNSYAELVRPNFHARDLLSDTPPVTTIPLGAGFAALFPLKGDFLADYAATKAEQILNNAPLDTAARAADNHSAQQALITPLSISPIRPGTVASASSKARPVDRSSQR